MVSSNKPLPNGDTADLDFGASEGVAWNQEHPEG